MDGKSQSGKADLPIGSEEDVAARLNAALAALIPQATSVGYSELDQRLTDIESALIDDERSNHATRVLVRRQITWHRLMFAQEAGEPYEICSELFRGLCLLGFNSFTGYVAAMRTHALYCVASGQRDVGLQILGDLESLLSAVHVEDVRCYRARVGQDLRELLD